MPGIKINAAIAQQECPEAYRRICDRLAKSKAGKAGKTPEALNWGYYWAEAVTERTPAQPKTADVAVADRMRRVSKTVTLAGGRHNESVPITPTVVKVIEATTKARWLEDDAEQKRIAKLTPAEREAELHEVLFKLLGTPGFAAFTVRKP